jgi:hypothetical protein
MILEVVMPASRLTALRVTIFITGLAFAAVVSLAPARAQQQQAPQQSVPEARIVVIGEGSVSVAPDYAQVSAGVTTHGKSVKDATDANSKVMADIMNALAQAGIASKDIQTSHFSLQPIYIQTESHEPKLSSYNVSNQIAVEVRDVSKAGDILERMVNAGVTNVGGIQFLHSDPSKLLDQAREAAVADAKRKAGIYAKASGLTLGRVVWITEDSGLGRLAPMQGRLFSPAAAAPVPVSTGEDTLRVEITVGFDIAN